MRGARLLAADEEIARFLTRLHFIVKVLAAEVYVPRMSQTLEERRRSLRGIALGHRLILIIDRVCSSVMFLQLRGREFGPFRRFGPGFQA